MVNVRVNQLKREFSAMFAVIQILRDKFLILIDDLGNIIPIRERFVTRSDELTEKSSVRRTFDGRDCELDMLLERVSDFEQPAVEERVNRIAFEIIWLRQSRKKRKLNRS
jgi:hypothetical protein